jgi:hypothetical protein
MKPTQVRHVLSARRDEKSHLGITAVAVDMKNIGISMEREIFWLNLFMGK